MRPLKPHPPLFDTSTPLEGRRVEFIDIPEQLPEEESGRVFLNVVVRIRPLLEFEATKQDEEIVEASGRNVKVLFIGKTGCS